MNAKFLLGILILVLFLIGGGYVIKRAQLPAGTDVELLQITESDWILGNKNAPVVIIEYGDFQCPACGAYHPLVKEVIGMYPVDVAFVFRHFPLVESHQKALVSALVAEAAGAQGKFFEMEDLLFSNQQQWTAGDHEAAFRQYADSLSLDLAQFEADRAREDLRTKIMDMRAAGFKIGVRATPTFFINGEKIVNPRTVDEFKVLIESAKNKATIQTSVPEME